MQIRRTLLSVGYSFLAPSLSCPMCATFGSENIFLFIHREKYSTFVSIILGLTVSIGILFFSSRGKQVLHRDGRSPCVMSYQAVLLPLITLVLHFILSRSLFRHISICIIMQRLTQRTFTHSMSPWLFSRLHIILLPLQSFAVKTKILDGFKWMR